MSSGKSGESLKESPPEATMLELLALLNELKEDNRRLREDFAASKREAEVSRAREGSSSKGFLSPTLVPSVRIPEAPHGRSDWFTDTPRTPLTAKTDITMKTAPPAESLLERSSGETPVEGAPTDRLKDFKFKMHRDHFLKGGDNWIPWSTKLHTMAATYGISKGDVLSRIDRLRIGAAMKYNLAEGPLALVAHLQDANDIYNTLRSAYAGSGVVLREQLRTQISNLTLKSDTVAYVTRFNELLYRLRDAGGNISDEEATLAFIRGTESRCPDWCGRNRSYIREGRYLSLEGLAADLTDEMRSRCNKGRAMATQSTPQTQGGAKSSTTIRNPNIVCHNCNKTGHIKRYCKTLAKDNKESSRTPPDSQKSSDKSGGKEAEESQRKDGEREETARSCSARLQPPAMEDIRREYDAFMLQQQPYRDTQIRRCFSISREPTVDSSWLWDSGANVHMISDMAWLDEGGYAPISGEHPIRTGNGPVYPTDVGAVTLRFETGVKMTLREVLYVQEFPMNVFSGERLYLSGGYVLRNDLFAGNDVHFASLDITERGFFLSVDGSGYSAVKPRIMATVIEIRKSDVWHKRLGHPGP
ncbi:hypothetical protein CPLU01_12452 [Colletotrichum plurivorum]|uniref:CCHC-type domain-containing protein n=1 Tax=Colletotrichum plurivorum TaxID=2175906 RepID=A0A8H6JZ37_9PEZI|nr:hypothetical protein CPLU01_12452 [Colletotrichum plurivorum]